MSLSTDDPLQVCYIGNMFNFFQFHSTETPLVEEYVVAARVIQIYYCNLTCKALEI